MRPLSLSHKRLAAFLLWAVGVGIFLFFAIWNVHDAELDAENRLIAEAGRSAAQLAGLLSLPDYPLDARSAKSIIDGAMEDDHVYAARVDNKNGFLAGQRRNYMWEPVPWDDEIAENCVQGINTLKIDGENAGSVSVWLSSRIFREETALVARRETLHFLWFFGLWTLVLILVLLNWGDFRRLGKFLYGHQNNDHAHPATEKLFQPVSQETGTELFNSQAALRYLRKNPSSFRVITGMFRQTFARGPELILRLYARGEIAALCHLGRMLELAAPCIGADNLMEAAKQMQAVLNDPTCDRCATSVEECSKILLEVLNSLNGREQWQTDNGATRSE